MNANKYKFYVRDIGISDEDLKNVLQNVIEDIAVSTKIFKKVFVFEILPEVVVYDFGSLLNLTERFQPYKVSFLTIEPFTDEQLLKFLKDPTKIEINVNVESDNSTPFSTCLEVVDILDENLNSIFDHFEHIADTQFKYKYIDKIKKPKKALCICSIIPNIYITFEPDDNSVKVLDPIIWVEGEPDKIPLDPLIYTTSLRVRNDFDKHIKTDWILKDGDGNIVWQSIGDSENLTYIKIPDNILFGHSAYIIEIKQYGEKYESNFSSKQFITSPIDPEKPELLVTEPGDENDGN